MNKYGEEGVSLIKAHIYRPEVPRQTPLDYQHTFNEKKEGQKGK
jgi:hypothetical protein